MSFLSAHTDRIFSVFRILAGISFATHGAQKVLGAFGGMPAEMMNPMITIAGWIELVGGALIAIGFFTVPAAFLSSGLMAAAYFIAHWPGVENGSFFPLKNGGEPALLYCWLFLYTAARGPGGLSVDAMRASDDSAT